MSYRKRSRRFNWGFVVVVSVLLSLAALVTLADYTDLGPIPTWGQLLEEAELSEPSYAAVLEGEIAEVHIIDVGQGDSILIRTPGANMLIDASEREYGTVVASYLERQGVDTLDYVVATHPHADHIGGLAYVVRELEVKNIIAPQVPASITPTTKVYKELLAAVKEKGLTFTRPGVGDQYPLGEGGSFTILGPVEASDEMNDNSVVLKFEYGNTSFLLTGDCEASMESEILAAGLDVSADVLKLGHHGSSTSTSRDWLDAVKPAYGAISCGKDNSYGHPHREIIQRLEDADVAYYRTDLSGTIVFETDGAGINVSTQKAA